MHKIQPGRLSRRIVAGTATQSMTSWARDNRALSRLMLGNLVGQTADSRRAELDVLRPSLPQPECGHLNWPRLGGLSSRIVAPPGW
jgi:hypothetical protein